MILSMDYTEAELEAAEKELIVQAQGELKLIKENQKTTLNRLQTIPVQGGLLYAFLLAAEVSKLRIQVKAFPLLLVFLL